MRSIFLAFVMVLVSGVVFASDVYVQGHMKDTDHDGIKDTYIQPYHRTAPDNNTYNNYETKGNVNPYNGQQGTVDPKPQSTYPQNSYKPAPNSYKSIYR